MKKLPLLTIPIVAFLLALIGSAYALPATTWTKYSGNPVLTRGSPGSWDDGGVLSVEVVHDGSQYRMWYTGLVTGTAKYQIGYATSADGLAWVKYAANPVLTVGSAGSWDSIQVFAPAVLFDGSIWRMWYSGNSGVSRIGYATSPDGINWTKYGSNPVLSAGAAGTWDRYVVFFPFVMLKDGIYRMWYTGSNGTNNRIGYATSTDGIHWTKHGGNPVLNIGQAGAWDNQHLYSPSVVFMNGEYHLWYQGVNASGVSGIGHATSPDGINWTKDLANPVLSRGLAGSWDAFGIYSPSVIYHGGLLRMWFHGLNAVSAPSRVGYAEANVTTTATPTRTPTVTATPTMTPTRQPTTTPTTTPTLAALWHTYLPLLVRAGGDALGVIGEVP